MEWPYSECGGDSDSNPDTSREAQESVSILGHNFELPKRLCADPAIFWEFFSPENLWKELSRDTREELSKHLPQFPDAVDAREKEATIEKLFRREPFRFDSSPLAVFQKNLEEGNYLPDVVRYRAKIAQSERHEQRYQECEHISMVARKLASSRKSLLELSRSTSQKTAAPFSRSSSSSSSKRDGAKSLDESVAVRARKRYLQEIACVTAEGNLSLSDSDEEAAYLEHHHNHMKSSITQLKIPRKPGRPSLVSAPGDMFTETGETKIHSTFAYKPKSNTSSCHDSGFPKTVFNEEHLRKALRQHRKRKTEDSDIRNESPVNDFLMHDTFRATAERTPIPVSNKKVGATKTKRITNSRTKTESLASSARTTAVATSTSTASSAPPPKLSSVNVTTDRMSFTSTTVGLNPSRQSSGNTNQSLLLTNNMTRSSPGAAKLDVLTKVKQNHPIGSREPAKRQKVSVGQWHETMTEMSTLAEEQLPELATDSSTAVVSLRQHACFMSLVRSIFCSTPDHRITFDNLQRVIRLWLLNGKSKTNDWFADCPNWLSELGSVVKFLVGEFPEQPDDFVPYIEFKATLQIYQWIGAGRDTDQHLLPLYRFWLEHRNEFGRTPTAERRTPQLSKVSANSRSSSSNVSGDDSAEVAGPRCPTTWLMRPERMEEVAAFRVQERQRYENPIVPFTYRSVDGYESVVGPVLGMYAQPLNKEANTLVADRPASVTLMSIVRDAVARLPNGEGSKAHVYELLKASQYVVPGSALQVHVNSVLERLQNDGDRCVLFDQRRKVFVYVHRSKSEAELRKLHFTATTTQKKSLVVGKMMRTRENAEDHETGSRLATNRTSIPPSLIKMEQVVVRSPHQPGTIPPKAATLSRQQISPTNNVFKIRTSKSPVVVVNREATMSRVVVQQQPPPPLNKIQQTPARDIEAHLDARHPPALVPKLANNKGTVKVTTTSGGTQSIQVSAAGARPLMSLLTTAQGQSVLMQNQRMVKVATAQSVLISQATALNPTPPALVSSAASNASVFTAGKLPVVRTSPAPALHTVTKVVRAALKPAGATGEGPRKGILNQATIKAVAATTTTTNPSPSNGSMLRTAVTSSLLGTPKPLIQNIVIRSSSPQTQQTIAGKRSIPLKTYSTMDGSGNLTSPSGTSIKSILVTSSAGDAPNVIKIRTSTANHNQLIATTTSSALSQTPKMVSTQGGTTQYLHIHPSAAGGQAGATQQFILNAVRQANPNTHQVNLPSSLAVKGPVKPGTTTQLVQLPAKTTLLKSSPVTARMIKAVTSQGGSSSPTSISSTAQSVVRTMTVGGSMAGQKVLNSPGMSQLVTLVGSGKATTHTTPIRIAKPTNVIQLSAANGTGPGTQYTVLSPGRSMIQVQQQQQGSKDATNQQQSSLLARGAQMVTAGEATVGLKPGIRMVNAANITRIGTGKPVLLSNKMTGNVTSLLRTSTAVAKLPATSASPSGSSASSTSLVIGGQTVKVPNSLNLNTSSSTARSPAGTTTQHVMIGNQLVKIQSANAPTADRGKPVILNTNMGQTFKVQSLIQNQGKLIKTVPVVKSTSTIKGSPGGPPPTTNRVVLVQGPGGQLLLPSNLQGGSINLKSLKMISVQQQQQQQSQPQQPQ